MDLVFTQEQLDTASSFMPVDWSTTEEGTVVGFKIESVTEDNEKNQLGLRCTVLDGVNAGKTAWHNIGTDFSACAKHKTKSQLAAMDSADVGKYWGARENQSLLAGLLKDDVKAGQKANLKLLVGKQMTAKLKWGKGRDGKTYLNWRNKKPLAAGPKADIPF